MEAETQVVRGLPAEAAPAATRVGTRARLVGLLGPLTVVAGVVWAIAQPYRLTLLHPRGEGFWSLFVQPPLWVVAAGILFSLVVARPLIADLDATEEERR
jgi:hypothetical protein